MKKPVLAKNVRLVVFQVRETMNAPSVEQVTLQVPGLLSANLALLANIQKKVHLNAKCAPLERSQTLPLQVALLVPKACTPTPALPNAGAVPAPDGGRALVLLIASFNMTASTLQ